jgi:Asparagine synthase
MSSPICEGLRQAGTRVVLTGWGGNECVEGSGRYIITELAREGKFLELSRVEAFAAPRGASTIQQAMHSYFYSGWNAHFREGWGRNAAFLGVEERHPFFDRRLAEFAFALPERQRSHRGLSRSCCVMLCEAVCRSQLSGGGFKPTSRRYSRVPWVPWMDKTPFPAPQSWRGAGLFHSSYLPLYRKLVLFTESSCRRFG